MKIKANFLLTLALVVTAIKMNPDEKYHASTMMEGFKNLDTPPDFEFVKRCEFHDYFVFSLVTHLGRPLSVGLFGNVHILYKNLETSIHEHYLRQRIPPNRGRGAPEVSEHSD